MSLLTLNNILKKKYHWFIHIHTFYEVSFIKSQREKSLSRRFESHSEVKKSISWMS